MNTVRLKQFETVRTTVTLPVDLMDRTQEILDRGIAPSRNALIVTAVERFLAELERQEIDRQFAAMADDAAYQALSEETAASFRDSDWEALSLAEGEAQ